MEVSRSHDREKKAKDSSGRKDNKNLPYGDMIGRSGRSEARR